MAQRARRFRSRFQSWGFLRERECQVFGLAAVATLLHLLDAAFVHINPGTSAGDHLVRGGLPAVLVMAAALAFPFLSIQARRAAAGV